MEVEVELVVVVVEGGKEDVVEVKEGVLEKESRGKGIDGLRNGD